MNYFEFSFGGTQFRALGSGALWWPEKALYCVSDLHLGKSERTARRRGLSLPPYETRDTLNRLDSDLSMTNALTVICLGDSFDDLRAADSLPDDERLWIARLQSGREWIWIEGNHDPGPIDFGGTHRDQIQFRDITFRHIATPDGHHEISGHFHPKANLPTRGRTISRPAFLFDKQRLILPAYGTYTGGLRSDAPVLRDMMHPEALAILTGPVPTCVPMPR